MEEIIGSLVNVSGHTFDMRYDLFFTSERVIAAIIRHPADDLKPVSVWKGLFLGDIVGGRARRLEEINTSQRRRRSLQAMTPDELVEANHRNFDIRYDKIDSVEIARRFFQWQLSFHVPGPLDTKQTIRFNLSKKQVAEAQHLLELTELSESKEK